MAYRGHYQPVKRPPQPTQEPGMAHPAQAPPPPPQPSPPARATPCTHRMKPARLAPAARAKVLRASPESCPGRSASRCRRSCAGGAASSLLVVEGTVQRQNGVVNSLTLPRPGLRRAVCSSESCSLRSFMSAPSPNGMKMTVVYYHAKRIGDKPRDSTKIGTPAHFSDAVESRRTGPDSARMSTSRRLW
jgi:hypothetical protein